MENGILRFKKIKKDSFTNLTINVLKIHSFRCGMSSTNIKILDKTFVRCYFIYKGFDTSLMLPLRNTKMFLVVKVLIKQISLICF